MAGAGGRPGAPLSAGPARSPSPLQAERDRYRRGRAARSAVTAAASTLAAGALLALAVTSTPGWPRVQDSFFDPATFARSLPAVLDGLWLNLRVMVGCALVIGPLGLLVALARTTRGPVLLPLRLLATAYTDVFRGLPLILVLLLVGYGVPGLRLQGMPTSAVFYGSVALVLTYSAYVAEVLRSGIESVHPGQRAAARALGLSGPQAMRFVVVPQAVRRVLPALLNDLVSLQKDSGLIAVLSVVDAVRAAQILTYRLGDFTPYLAAGACFVLLTIPMARLTDAVGRRWGTPTTGGAV